ncbi:hypothetical protein IFO70_03710 [Phormidium tenue FACHB-886]|nr:hypothetical protein [Phormidium tenue FACHB-886]
MFNGDSGELHQKHLISADTPSKQEQLAFDLENTQSEVSWLRHQVESLQQELAKRVQQQREIEQELQMFQQELGLMNQEIQSIFEATQRTFKENRGITHILLQEGELSEEAKEALVKLLKLIDNETLCPEEIGKAEAAAYNRITLQPGDIKRSYDRTHCTVEQFTVRSGKLIDSTGTFRTTALKLAARFVNLRNRHRESKQQRSVIFQQTRQHTQQSADQIRQSKQLLGNKPALHPATRNSALPEFAIQHLLEQPKDQITAQQQRVEQQLEQTNKLQQRINDQKRWDMERGQPGS